MLWNDFKSSHPFCASIGAMNGERVSDFEISKIADLCHGTNVAYEVSPERDQIWVGGIQNEVIEVLDGVIYSLVSN